MNKRIKELAEKAGIVNRKFAFGQYWEDDLTDEQKKFAKLIIKECANFVENIFDDDDGSHATCKDYAKGIKKYFRVKE
jgi:hypothetical protein